MSSALTHPARIACVLWLLAAGAAAQPPSSVPGPELRDGRVVMPDGREMSQIEFTRELLRSDNVKIRDADGNLIDGSRVRVGDDGKMRYLDGSLVNIREAPASGTGGPVMQMGAVPLITPRTGRAAEEEPDEREADEPRTPPPTGEGIPVILGGSGKDGAAKLGEIPLLK